MVTAAAVLQELLSGWRKALLETKARRCGSSGADNAGAAMLCSLHPSKLPPGLTDLQPLGTPHIKAREANLDYNSDYHKFYTTETVGHNWTTDSAMAITILHGIRAIN